MAKKILGLKVGHDKPKSGPTPAFVIGWALIEEKMNKKENLTEEEIMVVARVEIGKMLKETREQKELSVYAVAKSADLSIGQINAIESGEKAYTIDSFLKICRALDMYFFLKSRDGKHLDGEDMAKKAGE